MSTVKYTIDKYSTYETHGLEWYIPNFLVLLDSPVREIRAVPATASSPRLRLQFNGYEKDIIELSYCSSSTFNYLKGDLNLKLNNNVRKLKTIHLNLVQAGKWTYLETLFKRHIIQAEASFLKSGSLTFSMSFNVMKNVTIDPTHESLIGDLKKILNLTPSEDAVIKSTDGQEYNVHKTILASQSAVLKAHFDHGTTESQTNVVEAPFESAVLEEVLTYMYIVKIPRMKDLAKEILAAADYYQLDGLKSLCEEELVEQLTADNANDMFELANAFQAPILKRWSSKHTKKLHCCVDYEDKKEGVKWKIEYYL